jgi:phosphate ABC transporter phosphate-binding protein
MRRQFIPAARGHGNRLLWCSVVAILCLYLLPLAHAQPPEGLRAVHAIWVDSFGSDNTAEAIRQRLDDRLKKSGNLKLADNAATADVTLRGTSNIWPIGVVSLDPRSHSAAVTNYQGYLSVEAVGRSGEILWSYLATPSRFRAASITNDLADQIASRFLQAIHGGMAATAVAPGRAARSVHLNAAGATLPAPLYLRWFELSGTSVSYDAVGSEAGIQQLIDGKVDFAASDMPLSDEDVPAQLHLLEVPTVVGGVVPIYNLPGLHGDLQLTPEILVGIYSGSIHKWNDPRILEVNHGVHLPNADIAVIHREDGSGTTFVWTSYLSLVSPEWKNSVGAGPHVNWPVGTGATGNEGIASMVQSTRNAIGYVELIYAIQHHLTYAAVRNPAGRFIKADLASISAAAAGRDTSKDVNARSSILNVPSKDAYPISTFTWLLVPTEGTDQQKKSTIAQLLSWMLTTGQKQCASMGYLPLPREIAAQELQRVAALR